jgi:hypothetical protein
MGAPTSTYRREGCSAPSPLSTPAAATNIATFVTMMMAMVSDLSVNEAVMSVAFYICDYSAFYTVHGNCVVCMYVRIFVCSLCVCV